MPYQIKEYSYQRAKKLGVTIKQSTLQNKKIDVFDKSGKRLVSIGALGMDDFPTHKQKSGLDFANERRRLYKIRHEKTRHRVGTPSYYADKILW